MFNGHTWIGQRNSWAKFFAYKSASLAMAQGDKAEPLINITRLKRPEGKSEYIWIIWILDR